MKVSREDSQASAEPLDSYVLVEKEDVLEAIGTFVAAYLVSLPEAQKMKPEELQKAVGRALKVSIPSATSVRVLTASSTCHLDIFCSLVDCKYQASLHAKISTVTSTDDIQANSI